MPDTVAQAAQVAQQGLQDLGQGLRKFGESRNNKILAQETAKTLRNTEEGNALAASVDAGQITPGQAIQLSNQVNNVSPMQLFGSLLKASMNPNLSEAEKLAVRNKLHKVTSAMAMLSAMKKGGGKPDVLNSDKAFVESVDAVLASGLASGKLTKEQYHKKRAKLMGMKTSFGKEGIMPRDFQGEMEDLLDFTIDNGGGGQTDESSDGTSFDDQF